MCIFTEVVVEVHTSQPRLKPDYWLDGETAKEYRSRQFVKRRDEREQNRWRQMKPVMRRETMSLIAAEITKLYVINN